jgi:hypothetical protein
VFVALVPLFVIMLMVQLVLSLIFAALPGFWRTGLSSIISGTLIAQFVALVMTLVYYRLCGQA